MVIDIGSFYAIIVPMHDIPEEPNFKLRVAWKWHELAISKESYDEALSALKEVEEAGESDQIRIAFAYLFCYEKLGKVDETIEAWKKIIALPGSDPEYIKPYWEIAFLYKRKGDKAEALKWFMEVRKRGYHGVDQDYIDREIEQLTPQVEAEERAEKVKEESVPTTAEKLDAPSLREAIMFVRKIQRQMNVTLNQMVDYAAPDVVNRCGRLSGQFFQLERYLENEQGNFGITMRNGHPDVLRFGEDAINLHAIFAEFPEVREIFEEKILQMASKDPDIERTLMSRPIGPIDKLVLKGKIKMAKWRG